MNHLRLKSIIDKYLSGTASAQEVEAIESWYKEEEIRGEEPPGVGDELRFKLFENINRVILERSLTKNKSNIKRNRLLKIAASLFIVGIVAYYFSNSHQKNERWTSISAKNGEVKKVVLEDSSVVWLNVGTQIRYASQFNQQKRELWLKGEAYFDIKHDQTKPFIVHTGKLTTSVLGTAFNINNYGANKKIVVTVSRGKVGLTGSLNTRSIFLTANQQGVYKEEKESIEKSEAIAKNVSAWINGELSFKEMKLSEIAERLEQRFGVRIVFSTKKLEKCPLTASFRKDATLEEILSILSEINNCKFTKVNKTNNYLISGKGCN